VAHRAEVAVRARALGGAVRAVVWTPDGAGADDALPLLVVHDGPEYERRAGLTRFAAAAIAAGRLPPHRLALLAPGDRDEWYSASARYAGALANDVLPALGARRPVALGASLGALAALHAHRRFPDAFAGLVLQSGSFFVPRFDAHEGGFARYGRIVRFVRSTLRDRAARPVPVALTCGAREENVHNNRVMAAALRAQGYAARLHEVDGGHDFPAWRAALDPHLTALLARVWVEDG
jgi:enterochelin esterase-like enzyme